MEILFKNEVEQKISLKEYIAYFSYGLGEVTNYAMVGTYLTIFYTDYLMISASIAGIIFLIARVWDAINDPMMAAIIDCTNSSKGKFRYWMKWVPIFIVLTTILTFIPWDMKGGVLIGVAGISYILWGMVYTVSDVPFWSLSTVMSNNALERAKAVTVANTGVSIGFLIPPLIVPILSKYIGVEFLGYSMNDNAAFVQGLPYTIIIISMITLPLMIFGYLGTKERRNAHVEKVKIKDMLGTVKNAKPLFLISIIFMLLAFTELSNALMVYFFIVNLGDISYQSTITFFSMFSFALLVFYPILLKYLKKKNLLQLQLVIDTILRLFLFIVGYDNPLIVVIVLIALKYFETIIAPIIPNMIGECVEYCEYKTGKRTEGIVFSFQTFSGKLKTAIALGLSGFVLTWIGYTPDIVKQNQDVVEWLFIICILVPIVGNILRIILLRCVRYTEDEYNLVVRYLNYKYEKIEALELKDELKIASCDKNMNLIKSELTNKGLE